VLLTYIRTCSATVVGLLWGPRELWRKARPELRELVGTLAFVWPLSSLRLMVGSVVPAANSATSRVTSRAFEHSLVLGALDSSGSEDALQQAVERRQWLGQRSRLVNLYRVAALHQLLRARHGSADWRRGGELAIKAVNAASGTDDRFRSAKTALVALESQSGEAAVADRASKDLWETIRGSEAWRPMVNTAHMIYRAGRLLRLPRLRAIALALLETS
jgi:hypothetical protein